MPELGTVTIHKTVRGVPLRVEYSVQTDDDPVLEAVFVGAIKVWPVSDCRAVLRWFEHEALEAMHEDFGDVSKALEQEAIDREQDEQQDRKREDGAQFGVGA
jgi:hypothetical protein